MGFRRPPSNGQLGLFNPRLVVSNGRLTQLPTDSADRVKRALRKGRSVDCGCEALSKVGHVPCGGCIDGSSHCGQSGCIEKAGANTSAAYKVARDRNAQKR